MDCRLGLCGNQWGLRRIGGSLRRNRLTGRDFPILFRLFGCVSHDVIINNRFRIARLGICVGFDEFCDFRTWLLIIEYELFFGYGVSTDLRDLHDLR